MDVGAPGGDFDSPRRPMRASRFTEEQIIGMLKEQEGAAKTTYVFRKHGFSSAIFYKIRAKFVKRHALLPPIGIES